LIDTGAPELSILPKLNILANPSISPDPKRQPFDTLASKCYKKAENCVHPIWMTLPKEHHILHHILSDPLISLPVFPKHPPDFMPPEKFTEERREKMKMNLLGFLWLEEEKLVLFLIKSQEEAIAWDPTEHGNFRKDYFESMIILTVPHTRVKCSIPILPGIYNEVVRIIKEKIKIGVHKRSNSSFQSKWFCILKKDGKSLWIIHDLQALNMVTVKDSGVPPILEFYAENLGSQGSYTGLDLFVTFDHWSLAVQSWDLTTFQMLLSLLCLTILPMGAMNSMQILQGDISFIKQEEMPDIAAAFMDDRNVRGPPTHYETNSSGWYASTAFADPPPQSTPVPCTFGLDGQYFEVIPENNGIHWLTWEQL